MQKPDELPENETSNNGVMQVIYGKYPPNYETILAAFPMASNHGVVFAYGDEIYVPSGIELTHALKVHEATHGIRQKEIGLDEWWRRYIEDEAFRYYEELVAHFSEYMAMIKGDPNEHQRGFRTRVRKFIAKKLSSPLYGCKGGIAKAQRDLKNMEAEYREGKATFDTGAIQ